MARSGPSGRELGTGAAPKRGDLVAGRGIPHLVDEGQALPAAFAYAKKLAAGPIVAIDLARRCVFKALTGTLDEILDYEAVAGTMSAHTEAAAEGTKAFVEKRKPVFKGR
jgi:2-(1,2-epoxy-1,2-dihydrophenyl)acetyl-CoA isomerase